MTNIFSFVHANSIGQIKSNPANAKHDRRNTFFLNYLQDLHNPLLNHLYDLEFKHHSENTD